MVNVGEGEPNPTESSISEEASINYVEESHRKYLKGLDHEV